MSTSLIHTIQHAILIEDAPAEKVLRLVKTACMKMHQTEIKELIEAEINGYSDTPLPDYRKLRGNLISSDPHYGLIPVNIPPHQAQLENFLTQRNFTQPIAAITQFIEQDEGSSIYIKISNDKLSHYKIKMDRELPLFVEINKAYIHGILESVTNFCLNWSLEMETLGILGEGLGFSDQELAKLKDYSPNIQVYNGDLNLQTFNQGSMVISNDTHNNSISPEKLYEIIELIKGNYQNLPTRVQKEVKEILESIDAEETLTKKQKLLKSISPMLSGIGSSLVASFILSLLENL
jgi:hypothetical protein